MGTKSNDEEFKNNVRHALLFFSTARQLGFPAFLTDEQEDAVVKLTERLRTVGEGIIGLLKNAEKTHKTLSPSPVDGAGGKECVDEIKCIFLFLRSLDVWLTQDKGHYLVIVKESIKEALRVASEGIMTSLHSFNTAADKHGKDAPSPSTLPALFSSTELCELLSAVDEYRPVNCSLKFAEIALKFKAAIMKISTSTRNRIVTHDFKGVVQDLNGFDRSNPLVSADVKGILREVYKSLEDQQHKIEKSVLSFKLSTTTEAANQLLIDGLRELYGNSMRFVPFLASTQVPLITKVGDIAACMTRCLHRICKECMSCIDDLQISSAKCNFMRTEELLKSATSVLSLLDGLVSDMMQARAAQEPFVSEVCSDLAPSCH